MTEINNKNTFDKFEKEKLCNLLECTPSEIDNVKSNADKIFSQMDVVIFFHL